MYLRKLQLNDAKDLYSIYSNPNVTYPAGFKPVSSILEMENVINTLNSNNDQAIIYEDKVIGIIGLDYIKKDIYMLGFLLHENYWNQGLGTKACQLYLKEIKKQNIQIIYADCFIDNIASMKLLEKLGFEYINDYLRSFSRYDQPQVCHFYKKELFK